MGLPIVKATNMTALRDRAPVSVCGDTASTPYLVKPQTDGSLGDLPYANAAEDPAAVVLSRRGSGGKWRGVTAAEFATEVTGLAKGLIAAGIGPGDRIALMSRTCYEWTLLDFATWAVGGVLVPVYPTSSAEQAATILSDAQVTMVFAEDEACAEVLAPAFLSPRRLDQDAIRELTELGYGLPDESVAQRRAALNPDTIATIIYTSGTTGEPKGVPLTHGNFLDAAANCTELLRPVFDSVSGALPCTLLFLPLAHVLGRTIEVSCVQARIRFGHSPSIKPAELRPDLESFGATFLVGVPYLFEKIHQLGRADAQAMHAARVYDRATDVAVRYGSQALLSLAGEGTGPSIRLRAEHLLFDLLFFAGAGVMIYEGYGLTETTGPSTVNPPLRPRPGTVGPPVPGAAVRICADGEILLRGPFRLARRIGPPGPGRRRRLHRGTRDADPVAEAQARGRDRGVPRRRRGAVLLTCRTGLTAWCRCRSRWR
jgi:long-chain acyl-CoA synthetase